MALQPVNLGAFQGSFRRTGGLASAFQQGRTFREQRRVRDEQSQLLNLKIEEQEVKTSGAQEKLDLDLASKKLANLSATEKFTVQSSITSAIALEGVPFDQIAPSLRAQLKSQKDAGIADTSDLEELLAVVERGDEEEYERQRAKMASLAPILGIGRNGRGFQKTGSFLVRAPDGSTSLVTGVFDPATGELTTASTTFGESEIISSLGETAEEQTARRIGEAGGKAEAVAEVELETKPIIAATTKAATQAITTSGKAFEQLGKIRGNVININEGIRLLDEGANTGPVLSLLPSVLQASVQLDNIQRRMGLDVIGNVTFGALSKGELDLALAVALPTKLGREDLRDWLVRKKEAQIKLADYIGEVAVFMGTAGNTVPDWIEIHGGGKGLVGGEEPVKKATLAEIDTLVTATELATMRTRFPNLSIGEIKEGMLKELNGDLDRLQKLRQR